MAMGGNSSVVGGESPPSALVVELGSSDDSEVESPGLGASDAPVAESSAGGGSGRITGVTTGSGSVPESSLLVPESVGSVGSTPMRSDVSVVPEESLPSALVVAFVSPDDPAVLDSEVEAPGLGAADAPVAESSAGGGSGRITGVTTGSGSVPESSLLVPESVG